MNINIDYNLCIVIRSWESLKSYLDKYPDSNVKGGHIKFFYKNYYIDIWIFKGFFSLEICGEDPHLPPIVTEQEISNSQKLINILKEFYLTK